ncbi:MAG TPA: hypothetical protein VLL77_04340, partial [Anaerolineales bacterium]|nr:hypothetical protein [Anaerolineales bacterium]
RLLQWCVNASRWLAAAFFTYEPRSSAKWLGRLWVAALFLGGALAWYSFFNGGSIDFTRHDWIEAGHRYAFLQDAARAGALPLHMPGEWALRNVTDRFMSVADTNLSPQLILLRFMGVGRFILLNALLLYSVGFAGLLLLRRRFQFSPLAFTAIYLLLFFGGHVVAHLSVGHVHWVAYFLFPYFLLLVVEAIDGPRHPWRWTLYLSVYMLAILLQGAFHLFTASIFFLGLLALSHLERFGLVLRAMVAAGLVGAVRILPPLLHASEYDTEFLSGFATMEELLEGLVHLVPPRPELVFRNNPLNPLGWWEMDYYIGVLGLAFVVGFSVYGWLQGGANSRRYRWILAPVAIMVVLTIGQTYGVFHEIQFPLLSTQRVSTRLLHVPLSILVLLAAIGFQQLLNNRKTIVATMIALAIGSVGLAYDLWTHFQLWRVANISALFTSDPIDMSLDVVANHADPAYIAAIVGGTVITLASLIILGYLSWKETARATASGGL